MNNVKIKDRSTIDSFIHNKPIDSERPVVVVQCLVYNHESYLDQCLSGFAMQITTFPFVAIVHDDVSTDKSVTVIRRYAEKYPDIIKPMYDTVNRYSEKTLEVVMNELISSYNPDYVAFCEGDDYWIDPYKLQRQYDFMEQHMDYNMCFHNALVDKYTSEVHTASIFTELNQDCDLDEKHAIEKWAIPTQSMFIRAKNYLKKNWLIPIYSGDYSLILRLFHTGKIRYLNFTGSVYRVVKAGGFSMSANADWGFVASQQIMLLEDYNNKTNGKYSIVINKVLKKKKDYLGFQKARRKYGILSFFRYPHHYLSYIKARIR